MEKAREFEKNGKNERGSNLPYPKFEVDLPKQYNEKRIQDTYKFKGDQEDGITNGEGFQALLKALYGELDTLFSSDLSAPI